ncbi:hypothetical protein [Massilia sp. erpn]|uniref:hypothetical protein n=1 Tax=Massilia sp. erpn TaxID=2738142 RepID=UPI002105FFFF|nr:hypothetical protein [Massilia sp. erpn]UTY60388.1 hypothetical protein HPQ68_26270 [Massilia sp. erpn]
MRQGPVTASIGELLQKLKKVEHKMRSAGLPLFLARLPVWVLCLHYCVMMRGKTTRIRRIARHIESWLSAMHELVQQEETSRELLDIGKGMQDDIEATKRTLLSLRELCVNIGEMFSGIGFRSRLLDWTQNGFLRVIDDSCSAAINLQITLASHDERVLALLRQEQAQQLAAPA